MKARRNFSEINSAPVFFILELGGKTDYKKLDKKSANYEMYKGINFPQLDGKLLDSLHQAGRNYDMIYNILNQSKFQFPIYPQIIENISANMENFPSILSVYILYSFVSWFYFFQKSRDTSQASIIFNSLLAINDTNYVLLAVSAFIFGYQLLLETTDVPLFPEYLKILMKFFDNYAELPSQSIDLLPLVLSRASKTLLIDIPEISSFISVISVSRARLFEETTADSIISNLQPHIYDLIIPSLELFINVIKLATPCFHVHLFSVMPAIILDRIEKQADPIYPPSIKFNNNIELPKLSKMEGLYIFSDHETFKDGIDMHPRLKLSGNNNLCPFATPDIQTIVTLFLKSLTDKNYRQVFMNSFFEEVKKRSDTKYHWNYIALAIFIANEHPEVDISSFLINSSLFDPNITSFNLKYESVEFDSLRNTALCKIIQDGALSIQELIQKIQCFPYLLTEMIYRTLNHLKLIICQILIQPEIIKFIHEIALYYRALDLQSNENTEAIELARSSLFYIFRAFLSIQEVAYIIFTDTNLIESYLTYFFEQPVRPLMIDLIGSYLIGCEKGKEKQLIESMASLIGFVENSLSDPKASLFMNDILDLFNSIISQTSSLDYKCLFDALFPLIASLQNDEISKNLFEKCLSCMKAASKTIHISSVQVSYLEVAIRKIYDDISDLYPDLIELLVGETDEIQNDYVINLLYKLYYSSHEFLDFINKLCDNKKNCIKCHDCELDNLFITTLHQFRIIEEDPDNIVPKILKLFIKIATISSSPSIVSRFMSLLSPINTSYLSHFEPQFAKALYDLILDEYWKNSASFQLGSRPYITQYLHDESRLNEGFSLTLWIYINVNTTREVMPIVQVVFHFGVILVNLVGRRIVFNQSYNGKNEEIEMNVDLEFNQWNLVSFCYQIQNEKAVISPKYNLAEDKIFSITAMKFSKEDFSIAVGGKIKNMNSDAEVGAIGLFPLLKPGQFFKLFFRGPCSEDTLDSIFYFLPKVHPIDIAPKFANENSFGFSLVKLWKLDLIMPLFALFDIPFQDVMYWIDAPRLSLCILSKALLINEDIQKNFVETKKFSAIACVLTFCDARTITADFYFQFFSLFQLLSYQKLRKQLFLTILTNNELWIVATKEDHEKILDHWARVLFPLATGFCTKSHSFENILNYLQIYYYFDDFTSYEAIEKIYKQGTPTRKEIPNNQYYNPIRRLNSQDKLPVVQKRVRRHSITMKHSPLPNTNKRSRAINLDIPKCRAFIHGILLTIADSCFTLHDFEIICQEIVAANDHCHSLNLLFLLKTIVRSIPQSLRQINFTINDALILHEVISLKNGTLIYEMIEVIIALHRENVITTISLSQHFDLILKRLETSYLSNDFFIKILQLLENSTPELLSIACWYALNTNIEKPLIEMFLSNMNNVDFNYSNVFFIWPLYLIFETKQYYILDYIIKSSINKWQQIYASIEVLFKNNYEELKMTFLIRLCCVLCEKPQEINQLSLFFDTVTAFIFLRRSSSSNHNDALLEQFNQSCFENAVNEDSNLLLNVSKEYDMDSLYASIQKFDMSENNKKVGLRINSQGKWLDASLARNVIDLWQKQHVTKYDDICTFLSILMSHIEPEFIKNEIPHYEKSLLFHYFSNRTENIPMFSPDTLFDFYQKCVDSVNEPQLNMSKEIQKYYDDLEPYKAVKMECSMKSVEETQKIIALKKMQNRKIWERLWSSLSVEKGPWDSALLPEHRAQLHWKRDPVICMYYCPWKMRRNTKFNQHTDASRKRDSSIIKKVNEFIPKINRNTPLQLLDTEKSSQLQRTESGGQNSQKASISIACQLIKATSQKDGKLQLYKSGIEIIMEESMKSHIIRFSDIEMVLQRTRFHKKTAIEIFLITGQSYFINFLCHKPMAVIARIMNQTPKHIIIQTSPFPQFFKQQNIQQTWVNGQISNFEYLMKLNIHAGRSFNDISQYPFLPWVLADYSSPTLDLSNPNTFRDLTLPIGAISPTRLKSLKMHYEEMQHDKDLRPYLYSSGPVSQLMICLCLNRIEPFATLHIDLQGGQFDLPDRLISSVQQTYENVTNRGNEYWELIPEFFFLPDFLTNENKFDLGFRQGKKLDSIELPKWCLSPIDFIYKHRKALESKYVTQRLNHWIDLTFGYKQRGNEADAADNIYLDKLYDDVWEKYDVSKTFEIEAFLTMVGQIPPQIFDSPHPQRKDREHKIDKEAKKINFSSFSCVYGCFNDKIMFVLTTNDEFLRFKVADSTIKMAKMISIEHHEKPTFIALSNNEVVIKSGNEDSFTVINGQKLTKRNISTKHNQIVSMSCDGNWFVTSGDDSISSVYNVSSLLHPVDSIQLYRDMITCTCVSDSFKIIVNGTKDGGLIVGSVPNIVIVRVIDLGDSIPINVLVTKSFGFIVAYTTERNISLQKQTIWVFNVNGIFIRKREVESPILAWTTWRSPHGFDFIAFVTENMKIWVCEAYFLDFEPQQRILTQKSTVFSITYLDESESLAVLLNDSSSNMQVVLLPITIDDTKIEPNT